MRARVPVVLPRDYTHRPVSKISIEEAEAKIDKNQVCFQSFSHGGWLPLTPPPPSPHADTIEKYAQRFQG